MGEAKVLDIVGPDAFHRGRTYASAGAVLSVIPTEKAARKRLVGYVRGRGRAPYTVIVTPHQDGLEAGFSGTCTCPMGFNCKHVAAVVLSAGQVPAGSLVAPTPTRRAGAVPRRPARVAPAVPEWARALQGVLPVEGRAGNRAVQAPTTALQFDLTDNQKGPARLILRPVVRGSSGRWVRTGISWGSLAHHRGPSAAAVRLLEEIYLLNCRPDHRYSYYGRDEAVYLDAFPTGRIWDVLAQAREAGLPLVRAGRREEPVLLACESARLRVDVTAASPRPRGGRREAGGGAWALRPAVVVGSEVPDLASSLLLGDPAHGLAWWAPGEGPGVRGGGSLHIARLDRGLPAALRPLVTGGRELPVQPKEQEVFLRDYFPALRRLVTVASPDGSVDLPEARPPRLSLSVAYGAPQRASLSWHWHYALGAAGRHVALWPTAHLVDPDRDPEAEAKILAEVSAHTDALVHLTEEGPAGPRLAADVELVGGDALIALAGVLGGLAEVADLDVTTSGEVPELRPASGPPVVSVDGTANGTDWFDLAVSVSVDGEEVPFAALFTALALDHRFLLLDSGTYMGLDRPELGRLKALIEEARGLGEPGEGRVRLSRFQGDLWAELVGLGVVSEQAAAWSASVRALAGASGVAPLTPPPSLAADLRPYQLAGFSWLGFLHAHRLGGVLADDMGLGKTLQAIALICKAREDAAAAGRPEGGGRPCPPFLVVAPTSVVGNWAAEVRRFAPGLTVRTIGETEARRGEPLRTVAAGADVVVTSYTLLRLEYDDYAGLDWAGMILDEAQAVKNHAGKGYQCVKRLPAPFKLAITGTPMENNLMELWAILSIVAPGLLPDPKRFAEYYRQPIERGDADRLALLRRRIRPLLVRRTKDEVAADLPAKIEQTVSLELNPRHRKLYDTYLARERQKVLGLLGDLEKHRIAVLTSLTTLRQAALDVSLVDPAHASVPSTKLDAVVEQLGELVAEGRRVLVFSQFTRYLARVRERLDGAGIGYCYLDGRTRNRAKVVAAFTGGTAPVFLMSIKAGGVGLNLTQADYCILLDPWWNPATEAQAVDRAHRIGQTRTVMVYRLVAKDTIEEKVMALKESKAKLFSAVMDGGGAGSASLTADDIRTLLDS